MPLSEMSSHFKQAKHVRRAASHETKQAFQNALKIKQQVLLQDEPLPKGTMKDFFHFAEPFRNTPPQVSNRAVWDAYIMFVHFIKYHHFSKKPIDAWCMFCLPTLLTLSDTEFQQCQKLLDRNGLWHESFSPMIRGSLG